MELEDQALAEGIADIIAFLEDDKELRQDTSSKQSVLNLEKLQTESFIITTENEVYVLKEAQAAIVKTVEELTLKQEREAQSSKQEYQELKLKQEQEAQSLRQEHQELKLKQEQEAQSLRQEHQELKLKQEQEAQSLRQEHQELKLKQEQEAQSSKKEYQNTQSKIIELQQIANILEERLVSINPREQQQRIDMETKVHKRLEEIYQRSGSDGEEEPRTKKPKVTEYIRQRDDLQKGLTKFYRRNYHKVVHEDLEDDVIDVYVRPPIEAFDQKEHRGIATGTQVTTYKQMLFRNDGRPYEKIYLRAKPGDGKTTFCKHLSAVWCQAHNPDEGIADKFHSDDINALRQYQLAFFIELRTVLESVCDVDEMITSFIRSRLAIVLSPTLLEKMLVEESCLIVLDGLNEWNYPKTCKEKMEPREIPYQKLHDNYTVLTTTRSCKFDAIPLKPTEYDRRLDIQGKSKCQIFASMIEAKLERQKNNLQSEYRNEIDNAGVVSLCFKHNKYCNQHMALLRTLGKMACHSIFNKENRQMLVMDRDFVGNYLTEGELKYCLKLGLLTQNKDYSKVSKRVSNVSFQHQTVHEFYSALYLQSTGTTSSGPGSDVTSSLPGSDVTSSSSERETIQNVIVDVCSDLSKILEISSVLIFLSGLDSQQCSQILKTLSTVVTRDSTCKAYRARTDLIDYQVEYKTMFNFQRLLTECACEMKLNDEKIQSLPLEDIMINKRSKNAEHVSLLRSILQTSETNIKTLDIQECVDTTEVTQIFDMLDLRSLRSLEKLVLWAVAREQDVQQLLQQSTDTLRTLCIIYSNYDENTRTYTPCSTELSEQCTDMIHSMQLLQAVRLQSLLLSHEQWERIVAPITSRPTMTQVWLACIYCRDHDESCPGVMIDLSRHENLKLLALNEVPVSQLEVNSKSLEECWLGDLPGSAFSFWQSLQSAQNLHKLNCLKLSEDDTRIMIETIPALLCLTDLGVFYTNLRDGRLRVSRDMTKLKKIALWEVTLKSESLRALFDTVSHLAQSVHVQLDDCTVLPEDEYQAIKQEISQSDRYSVMEDGPGEYGHKVFRFRTVTETNVNM